MPSVVVVPYDPSWPAAFATIRERIRPVLEGIAVAIEHVGSTAVPGLSAKPVIDIDVVVPDSAVAIRAAIDGLGTLGYEHRGNLGIEGREAFLQPAGLPRHHLYVCPEGNLGLRNHLVLRDHLRTHPDDAATYGVLKQELAAAFPDDIDSYVFHKTAFVLDVLRRAEFPEADLATIEHQNSPA